MTTRFRIPLLATFSLLALLLAAPYAAASNGYLVYEIGADSMGMASAVTGSVTDPEAVFYNPAGLSFSSGYAASIAAGLIIPKTSFKSAIDGRTTDAKDGIFFIPAVFASAEITKYLHVGVGAFSLYGLGIEWPDNWIGRQAVISTNLQTFTINPVVSLKITPDLSIAVGFQATKVALETTQGTPDGVGKAELAVGTWAFGGNLGIMYRVVPNKVSLGFSYRSRQKASLDGGRVNFKVPVEFNNLFKDQEFSTEMTLPDIINFGVSFKPIESLLIGFDINYVAWETYDKVVTKFNDPALGKQVTQFKYHAAPMYRLGAEYQTPLKGLVVRAGIAYDQCPANNDYLSPTLADTARVDITVGIGYKPLKWLKADIGYMFIYGLPNKATSDFGGPIGEYRTIAHVLGLIATVRFGQAEETAPDRAHDDLPPLVAPPPPDSPPPAAPVK
jgi:long-chain fatty acid transport protein